MKKILSYSFVLAAVAFALTGCLKDKGFENHEYGINDPDTGVPGVGFPLAAAVQGYGLEVSSTDQSVDGYVYVNLESGKPAAGNVDITLTDNTTALVNAYNTANGLSGSNAVLPLPAGVYNLQMALTIPAGGRNVETPLIITNTTGLDPNRSYAVGLTISGVTSGYMIADNLKNLFIIFSVKNRLDGTYQITGASLRAGDPALSGNFGPYERDLATSGANSVQWQGTVCWAGCLSILPPGYEPNITVDPVTNLVTSVTSPTGIYMTAPIIRTDIVGATQR
jgi:hypothetical protein